MPNKRKKNKQTNKPLKSNETQETAQETLCDRIKPVETLKSSRKMDPVKRIATKLGKRLGVARKGVFPRRRQVKEEEEEEEEEQQKKKKKKKKEKEKKKEQKQKPAGRGSPRVAQSGARPQHFRRVAFWFLTEFVYRVSLFRHLPPGFT